MVHPQLFRVTEVHIGAIIEIGYTNMASIWTAHLLCCVIVAAAVVCFFA